MTSSSTYGKIMILFDLSCGTGHRFEGWFRSNETFEEQQASGAIFCPSCGNTNISKAPMAPHVRRATARREEGVSSVSASQQRIREDLQALRRHVESTCDYVGLDFPQEARRIHYGETDPRNIYGEATEGEAKELASEGITFRRIPWFPRRND